MKAIASSFGVAIYEQGVNRINVLKRADKAL